MKAKTYPSIQETCDQAHLTCSTAVYYESQGNKVEALRCWRDCLAQLQWHNAEGYRPRTESERTLLKSLKKMQDQCQDRVGSLQAFLFSNLEAENNCQGPGNIGDCPRRAGTIKSPSLRTMVHTPKPLSPSPTLSGPLYAPSGPPISPLPLKLTVPTRTFQSADTAFHIAVPRPPRTSPVKRPFLSTLRPPRNEMKVESSSKADGAAAVKAATSAWSTTRRTEGANIARALPAPLVDASPAKQQNRAIASISYLPKRQQPSSDITDQQSSPVRMSPERPSLSGTKCRPHSTITPPRTSIKSTFESRHPESPLSMYLRGIPRAAISQSEQETRYHSKIELGLSIPPTTSPMTPPIPAQPSGFAHPNLPVSRKPVPKTALETPTGQSNYSQRIFHVGSDGLAEDTSRKPNQVHGDTRIASSSEESTSGDITKVNGNDRVAEALKTINKGVDMQAALQVTNEIVVQGDEVKWDDISGLDAAKLALKEAVVYPFLRPDLFSGLREPARGMLLFGPPGTGKTMLARAVATESNSTFFAISASSLTSKYLGESEKLVRALFALAKALAPSIIFVDEIDSLLSSRDGNGENEATRRIKTEFLIQWSDLAGAVAGKARGTGDASRVLVLAATNLPWAIDNAARRRFVRRQYIPLPEGPTRKKQLLRLLSHQKYELSQGEMERLVDLTDGFSGSDMAALAKDAAMGPLRSLGEALLHTKKDEIRPITFADFEASLSSIRPSVSKEGLQAFEDWAEQYGERV